MNVRPTYEGLDMVVHIFIFQPNVVSEQFSSLTLQFEFVNPIRHTGALRLSEVFTRVSYLIRHFAVRWGVHLLGTRSPMDMGDEDVDQIFQRITVR